MDAHQIQCADASVVLVAAHWAVRTLALCRESDRDCLRSASADERVLAVAARACFQPPV